MTSTQTFTPAPGIPIPVMSAADLRDEPTAASQPTLEQLQRRALDVWHTGGRHIEEIRKKAEAASLPWALDMGKALQAVKDGMPHGTFGKWRRTQFGKSDRQAQDYMGIAEFWDDLFEMRGAAFLSTLSINGAVLMVREHRKATKQQAQAAKDGITERQPADYATPKQPQIKSANRKFTVPSKLYTRVLEFRKHACPDQAIEDVLIQLIKEALARHEAEQAAAQC